MTRRKRPRSDEESAEQVQGATRPGFALLLKFFEVEARS
ncbi:hypothetical protein SCATT_56570 [Streptantibioticus cattleyicolor NRRL 8057 = DSM 46488]|uniref:Uncharacterized protein n=1 Tax=Streptantibioticus cattleyicolor (strain ATCC 35852 / DSM 46488 / JCM 4925 / NBRC 14057 / NRRL 8057) TaxID=1003195 RepID=G8X433_STREN|nr:hypothetical protein SCATT_56570 [Streptantibioticus cattleyicolor NRRL 8057 = DSM 46488]